MYIMYMSHVFVPVLYVDLYYTMTNFVTIEKQSLNHCVLITCDMKNMLLQRYLLPPLHIYILDKW